MALATAAAAIALPGEARALQPLEEFVTAAKSGNLDVLEAQATAEQRVHEARSAWAHIGPTFSAKAIYTRNQRLVTVCLPTGATLTAPMCPPLTPITITPTDQLDGFLTLNLPVVDVGSWQRVGSAGATADAAKARVHATGTDVEKTVVRAYLQVVADEATVEAAQRALSTSVESQAIVKTRREAGTASDLDLERARADVERQRQIVTSAEQARALSRRSLESLTGLVTTPGSVPLPEDGMADEPDLAALEPAIEKLPSVEAARLDARAASRNADAAWSSAIIPTIGAAATEHLTNATGFGYPTNWALAVTAAWALDPSAYFNARAQSAARAAADVRARRAVQQARDALHTSWQQTRADAARARAAKAEAEASARAAKLARERYQAGAATQLDVQQAERDAFQSEVSRIGAQADLAYARAAVRIDSGRPR